MSVRLTNQAGHNTKYVVLELLKLDKVIANDPSKAEEVIKAFCTLRELGVLNFGTAYTEEEFFVMKVKDVNAGPALEAYAKSAERHSPEYAPCVGSLSFRAGINSKFCKRPD